MPRSFGSRSRSSSPSPNRSSSSSQSYSRPQQPPQQTFQQAPMQQSRPSMLGGIGSTIVQGMAFGAGSEVGHQAVRSLMGGSGHGNQPQQVEPQQQQQFQPQQQQQQQNPCSEFNFKFVNCLKGSGNDIAQCQNLFDDLKSCESKFI